MTNVRDEEVPPYLVPLNEDGTEVLSFVPRELTGWAAYFPDGNTGRRPVTILMRFGARNRAEDGSDLPIDEAPIEIRELQVLAAPGVDLGSAVLRRIPFERIEAAVNQPRHRKVLARYVKHWRVVADSMPNVRTAEHPTPHQSWAMTPREPVPNPRPDLRLPLEIDPRNRPDAFYAAVADAFLWLASVSPRPAQELATANGVPVTTVHRWVREAKSRGLLLLPTKGDFA
jgi:hypothetical protein